MKKIFVLLFGLSLAITSLHSLAATERFEEGSQYRKIVPALTSQGLQKGKVEVIEFFWYGCPHCHSFEPHLNKWLENKPENVSFQRIPAIFNKAWVIHAKAFYTAEMLGITDKVHLAIFDAIHNKKKGLNKASEIVQFMAKVSGLDKQVISDTLGSFAIETKSRQAIQAARLHSLRGVPAVTINGKYLTSGRLAGDYPVMLEVIDFLIAKESQ